MKLWQKIGFAVLTTLSLAYMAVIFPITHSLASGTVWITNSKPNGDISVYWKGENFNPSTGTYTATFHVHNNRSYWIQVNPKWLQNFCTSGSQDPCLNNQSVIPQSGIGIQGNNGADITLTTNVYTYLNYHVVDPNCGTYQYDLFFTTNGGEYFGTTDLHTTWAAAMWKTYNTCVPGYPSPTPTPVVPTATPTPVVPTPTPTTPPPHVTVYKFVHGGSLQDFDFIMNINTAAGIISFPGSHYGITKQIPAGAFKVYEGTYDGYVASFSGDCMDTALPGHDYTCYIVNTYIVPTPTATPVPSDTPIPTPTVTPLPSVTPTATPVPTDTPVPTNTPVPTASPTPTNNNNCNNSQNNNGGDANNNCNNNNNNQSQNQTQNNNQTVNITYANSTPVYQVLGTSTANNLPSTGTPLSDLLFLGSMLPAGIFLRKKSK